MKKLLLLLSACMLITQIQAQAQPNEKQLWQDDVNYLKTLIHTKYPNLFYNISSQQFDAAIGELSAKIPGIDKAEFYAGIGKIMAMFHIGHTNADFLLLGMHHGHGDGGNAERLFKPVPIEFYKFSDGLYIKSADKKYKDIVGAKVLKIGEVSADEALIKMKPFVSYENEQGYNSQMFIRLMFPRLLHIAGISNNDDILKLQYLKDKQTNEISIDVNDAPAFNPDFNSWADASTNAANQIPLWKQEPGKMRNMVYVAETKTCYIKHSSNIDGNDQTIKDFFNQAYDFIDHHDVEKLVLDVRMNGGGNNQLNKPIITGIIRLRQINQKGRFFCIIGRSTFSAAQNLVNELEKYTEVIFVGEPTGENVNFYGDVRAETLPNSKLQVFCSWMWWQNFGPTDKRKATYPQLAADMTSTDYANNIDPAMNVIQSYKLKLSIGDTIKALEKDHKHLEALAYLQDYQNNPINKYYKNETEAEVNAAGYELLNGQKFDEAKNTFELNIKMFPNSANALDSYAECCLKMGLNSEAKKYYEKALAINPDYANAASAKKVIDEIK